MSEKPPERMDPVSGNLTLSFSIFLTSGPQESEEILEESGLKDKLGISIGTSLDYQYEDCVVIHTSTFTAKNNKICPEVLRYILEPTMARALGYALLNASRKSNE